MQCPWGKVINLCLKANSTLFIPSCCLMTRNTIMSDICNALCSFSRMLQYIMYTQLNAQQYSFCTCIPMNLLEFVLKCIKNQSQGQFYFPLSFLSSIPFHQTKTNAAMFSYSSSSTPHGLLLQCIVLLRSPVEWTPSSLQTWLKRSANTVTLVCEVHT